MRDENFYNELKDYSFQLTDIINVPNDYIEENYFEEISDIFWFKLIDNYRFFNLLAYY